MSLRGGIVTHVVGVLLAVAWPSQAWSAETGDFDGDGRITIADVVRLQRDLATAAGSRDALDAFACAGHWNFEKQEYSGLTYLEVLRRAVEDPMPHWIPIWSDVVHEDPLPPDSRVLIDWGQTPRVAAGSDRARVQLWLRNSEPVRAFSLILENADGILRVAPLYDAFIPPSDWNHLYSSTHANTHTAGDINVGVGYPPFLITRGRVVINFGLDLESAPFRGAIPAGDHLISVELRVPRGTAAGSYAIRILPTSQVLLDDGTLVAPDIESDNDLVVASDVGVGWDGGVPPIVPDPVARHVPGALEIRVTDAEGYPGDTVSVRVQMLAERPLNHLTASVTWPKGKLFCLPERPTVLFTNPDDGRAYEPYRAPYCSDGALSAAPSHQFEFTLEGAKDGNPNYRNRPLEYFRPLGKWFDVTEVRFRIPEGAGGGTEIPLTILTPWQEGKVRLGQPVPQYLPWAMTWPCFPPEFEERLWTHDDAILEHGKVTVLGDQDPDPDPEPPDIGVRWMLGDATGAPGELVEIPVLAAIRDTPFSVLRLVLELDPAAVVIDSAEFPVLSLKSGAYETRDVGRGEFEFFQECEVPGDPETCTFGIPFSMIFHETIDRYAVIDVTASTPDAIVEDWPGAELTQIAVLRVRIREDFAGRSTVLAGGTLAAEASSFDVDASSGAFLPAPDFRFSPANEVIAATITIPGVEGSFARGDANSDGAIDLSDAISILSFLFLGGGAPTCFDANDADDNSKVEITDAILVLSRLFLGTGPLAPPYPNCGADPTPDELGCVDSPCNGSL